MAHFVPSNPPIVVKIVDDKEKPPSEAQIRKINAKYLKEFEIKKGKGNLTPAEFKPEDFEVDGGHCPLPKRFVQENERTPEQIDEDVEYCVDGEDVLWLDDHNENRRKQIKKESFELTIDRLEKETWSATPEEKKEEVNLEAPCCICALKRDDEINQTIYCDLCSIAVHQDCYGVPHLPEGQWLCRKCKTSPMETVECELCPLRDGALKQTIDGKWAHVACAKWIKEATFKDVAYIEEIQIDEAKLRRKKKFRCSICQIDEGVTIPCRYAYCDKQFHVNCALLADLAEMKDHDYHTSTFHCAVHGKVKVDEKEFEKTRKEVVETINRSRRPNRKKKPVDWISPVPTVDDELMETIAARVGLDKSAVEAISGYWVYKRMIRGAPLNRRLRVEMDRVEKPPRRMSRIEVLRRGRWLFDKVRMEMELTDKREKNYVHNILAEKEFVPSLLTPLEDILVQFIDSLRPIDDDKLFHGDPLKQRLPNYSSIVKTPMDLGTMKRNAQRGEYGNEAEMKNHLDLIFNNCLLYYKSNREVVAYARERQQRMNRAYDDLVEYIKFMSTWRDELGLGGDSGEEEEETSTEKEESPKKKDGPPARRGRKRKADEPPPETKEVKRGRRSERG